MDDPIDGAAHARNPNPHDEGNLSAPRRRGGAWRRHLMSAAAGLAIVASAAGIGDRGAEAGQDNLVWTEGNGQPSDGNTVTSNVVAGVNETPNPPPNFQSSRDRPTGSFAGYIKSAKLGKLKGNLVH